MSTFRRSLPVTLTSFINKSGTIGLSIIPIILVERHVSTDASAWIMGSIKAAGLAGILIGGWSCDALGLKPTLLLSFAVSGLGLLPLPYFKSALLLAALGCLAQLGTALYYASARLLITEIVGPGERREAIAWQRTANNFAQIISYSLGVALSRFGTTFLILFDALTSFLATGVGAKILPHRAAPQVHSAPAGSEPAAPSARRSHFYQCALIIAAFSFLYELYSVGAAAQCKILFGPAGLAVFSEVMVINTVMCAAFSVVAAKRLDRAEHALPAGLLLQSLGLALTFGGNSSRMAFYLGSFVLTLGEIAFNALAGMVLIHITPHGRRQGTMYSTGIFIQFLGRIAGGALAFPMLIGSTRPLFYVAISSVPGLALCWASRHQLAKVQDARA